MHETKLIFLLRNLDKAEFRRFNKFLQSPFFNSSSHILDFYQYLKKYYPTFDSVNLTKEKAFKKLFPHQTYTDTKMRLLISDTKLLVEEYMVQLQLKKHSIERKKLWVNTLEERNMTNLYEAEDKKFREQLAAKNLHDTLQFKALHQLNHKLLYTKSNTGNRSSKHLLLEANKYLDLFYFTRKLQYVASIASQNKVYKLKAQLPFTDLVLKNISHPTFKEFYIFKILNYLIKLTQHGYSETTYQEVKALILQHFDDFAPELKLNILQLLFNHCIQLYKSGKSEFLKEQFAWYKFGFDKKVLVEQVQLTDTTYKNTIILGCHYQDLEWVKSFIDNYTIYLLPTNRKVVNAIGWAYYYFNKADYNEVVQQLQGLEFGTKHALNGRSLLLQSYIELYFLKPSNPDYIFHYANAFKRYLKRSNSGATTILAFSNYIDLSIKILEYHDANKWNYELLLQLINEDKPIVSKPWLLQVLKR